MENKDIVQLDIVTAFLESKVKEELQLRLPKEFGLANNSNVIINSNRIELGVSVTASRGVAVLRRDIGIDSNQTGGINEFKYRRRQQVIE